MKTAVTPPDAPTTQSEPPRSAGLSPEPGIFQAEPNQPGEHDGGQVEPQKLETPQSQFDLAPNIQSMSMFMPTCQMPLLSSGAWAKPYDSRFQISQGRRYMSAFSASRLLSQCIGRLAVTPVKMSTRAMAAVIITRLVTISRGPPVSVNPRGPSSW